MIQDDAIAAGALALHYYFCRDPYHSGRIGPACYDYKEEARAVIEAALPHLK